MNPVVGVLVVVVCLGVFALILAWSTRPAEPLGEQVRRWLPWRRRGQRKPSSRR
ncbi:MAG: hypothetical protein ACXVXA_18565 [Nocardioidaceae bacterium]